jgi:hypothetical protein
MARWRKSVGVALLGQAEEILEGVRHQSAVDAEDDSCVAHDRP